jgi:uncharacterized protein YjbJ (UPF0337 family)
VGRSDVADGSPVQMAVGRNHEMTTCPRISCSSQPPHLLPSKDPSGSERAKVPYGCIEPSVESDAMGARIRQLARRIKQAAGRLIGYRRLERQGRVERGSGRARQRLDEARDDATDEVPPWSTDRPNAVTEMIGPRQNGRRTTQQ